MHCIILNILLYSDSLSIQIISLLLYLFLGEDRRGSRSCLPSLPPLCSSTPAWWCCETRRCRRSWRHSSYSNTLSSPHLRKWTVGLQQRVAGQYQLQVNKESVSLGLMVSCREAPVDVVEIW